MTNPSHRPAREESPRSVRLLGSHERLLYLYSQRHPRHFCMVGEIHGHVTLSDFETAFEKLQRRHPHLSLAIRDGKSGPYFVSTEQHIPVRLVKNSTSTTWQEVVEEELRTRFDTWLGPLVRIALLPAVRTCGSWNVIVTFHHAIADGLSAVAMLGDLARFLDGEELDTEMQRAAVETLALRTRQQMPDSGRRPVPIAPDIGKLKEVARQPLWRPFETDYPRVNTVRLSAEETDGIAAACRREQTSVHGALCAALALASRRLRQMSEITITSPINVRHLVDVDRSEIGVYLTIGVSKLSAERTPDLWSLARQLNADLSYTRSSDGIAASLQVLDQTIGQFPFSDIACGLIGSLRYDAVVSNLGVIEDTGRKDRRTRLSAIWGPMVLGRIKDECVIGAATFGGRLHLTQTSPNHVPPVVHGIASLLIEAGGKNG